MRLKLREGLLGDYYVYPAYDLDFEGMLTDIPNAFVEGTNTYTGANNDGKAAMNAGSGDAKLRLHKFRVASSELYKYLPANIPHQRVRYGIVPDDQIAGAICKFNTNIQQSTTYPYADYGMTSITAEPSDFATNYIYGCFAKTNRSGTPSDKYRPLYPYDVANDWSSTSSTWGAYKDEQHATIHQFYTGVGSCHFCVYKIGQQVRTGPYYYAPNIGVGITPTDKSWSASNSARRTTYGICNKDNNPIGELSGLSGKYYHYFRFDSEYTQADFYSNKNVWQFFVHYFIAGEEFYGVATAQYSTGYNDQDVPLYLDVIALGLDFWGDAVIPGGGGGGTWGSDTVIGGGDGVWTYGSDSRGDGTGSLGTAIATEARTATDAFFTGSNGFKLHQLLAADIPDIYGALYSTSFIERYQNTMYSPLSAVLSVHMIPQKLLDLDHATTSSDLTLSGYNISTNVTSKQYPQIPTVHSYHLNKITLDATDTYLDYAPYTNAYLHLPYIGVLTLDINAIAAGELAIDYITDAITGNCSALVWCKDRDGHAQPKYVAQGNCAYTLPMFSYNQDGSALGRIASSALGLSMAVATGNLAGAAAGAGSLASGMFDAATAKQNTQVTGAFGGNAGMISDTMVWLEIVRPKWCNPEHYQLINGLPSQLSGTIQSFNEYGDGYTGYLRITDIDTDGIQATDAEIRQIEQQLKAGIFVDTT